MHQALVNLVRNAVEAMTCVSRPRRLSVTADGEGPNVSLTVRDTGPGIEEHQIERIFNPFFTTRSTGTGLGLAIVHRIVDVHDGQIAVFNDNGAVFTLSLPGHGSARACGAEPQSLEAAGMAPERSSTIDSHREVLA